MLRSIIAALLLSGTSIAGNYAYYPNSPLHMGGGYNPYLPDEIYLNCIEHDGEGPVDSDGATSTYVSLEQVKTREDFYRHIDFSASIAGSYKFYKGETSVQMESERAFHSDSFSWIVLFRSNYGRYILKNPRLKPEFSSYSHTELYQACGSEVAIHRNKSVMVYALFTIHNVSASERNRLETHFKGGANGGVWSASVESSYKKIVQEAAANNSVRLSVYALGGTGIVDLADIINYASDDPYQRFLEVPKVLRTYIKTMKPENAVATSFSTIPLKTLQRNIEPKFVNFNSKQISSIYNRYMDAVSVTNRIDSILYGPERDLYSLSKDEKILLEDLNVEYNNAQNLYAEAAKECFIEGNLCVIPTVKRTAIIWPRPAEISSCSFYQKKALELGAITQLQYQHFLRLGIAPVPFIGSWNTYGQVSCDKLEE